MKKYVVSIFFLLIGNQLVAQNTVGLLSYDDDLAYDGYNLFFPHNQSSVFLVNNCGELVHTWEDGDFRPGNSVYLNNNGDLIRCKRRTTSAVNDPIWAGGAGEIVDIVTWDNQPIATFELNDSLMRLHHDIAPMPNGNILMISWEYKSNEEAIEAGRDTSKLTQKKLWPEAILEWSPTANEIVWEWHVWDHLIQEYDSQRGNFGIVKDHPELVDLNYDEHDGHPDWLHINAVDYNPVLDHIVMSVPYFNEFWIIDHSTTTEEAASHSGGNSGKGGDLIYRWGNPQAYQAATEEDKQLFFQHDVNWADPNAAPEDPNYNKIVLFNNRVGTNFSTSNVIDLPWQDEAQSYSFTEGLFLPDLPSRTSSNEIDDRGNSTALSSAQLLPNDNLLVCAGRWGYTYEITSENQIVWEYITPIKAGDRVEQGDTTLSISSNLTFRVKRYGSDFEGFSERTLEGIDYVEMLPDTTFCSLLTPSIDLILNQLDIFPNPVRDLLNLHDDNGQIGIVQIYSLTGRLVLDTFIKDHTSQVDIHSLEKGLYIVRTKQGNQKIIKL